MSLPVLELVLVSNRSIGITNIAPTRIMCSTAPIPFAAVALCGTSIQKECKFFRKRASLSPPGLDGFSVAFVNQPVPGEVHHDIERPVVYTDVPITETIEEI